MYNNVGYTYYQSGDYLRALAYQQKALAIWEKTLPPMHPLVALCYCNLAQGYHELGELQTAARFMRQASDIISSSSLPNDHPRRVNYPKWADQYEKEAGMW